jgi:hypothetical protein
MKLHYKANDKLTFEVEGSGQKEIFKELALIQEIFGEKQCGMCKNTDIKFICRTVEGNDYYELKCSSCSGVLSFGQHKKGGTLFPKRRDDNNEWLPNYGWYKWQNKTT